MPSSTNASLEKLHAPVWCLLSFGNNLSHINCPHPPSLCMLGMVTPPNLLACITIVQWILRVGLSMRTLRLLMPLYITTFYWVIVTLMPCQLSHLQFFERCASPMKGRSSPSISWHTTSWHPWPPLSRLSLWCTTNSTLPLSPVLHPESTKIPHY